MLHLSKVALVAALAACHVLGQITLSPTSQCQIAETQMMNFVSNCRNGGATLGRCYCEPALWNTVQAISGCPKPSDWNMYITAYCGYVISSV